MLWLSGCGTTRATQVVKSVELKKVKIPQELLTLKELPRPYVESEIDILNAYSMLFYHYRQCEINLSKIRALSED